MNTNERETLFDIVSKFINSIKLDINNKENRKINYDLIKTYYVIKASIIFYNGFKKTYHRP